MTKEETRMIGINRINTQLKIMKYPLSQTIVWILE